MKLISVSEAVKLKKIVFFLSAILLYCNIAESLTNVTSCSTLNQANEYYTLNQSISNLTKNACINITAINVTLDCQGYSISNLTIPTIAVSSNQSNTTIKNCIISVGSNFSTVGYGIQTLGSYSSILNNTILAARIGIITKGNYSNISYNSIRNMFRNETQTSGFDGIDIFGGDSTISFNSILNITTNWSATGGSRVLSGIRLEATSHNALLLNNTLANFTNIDPLGSYYVSGITTCDILHTQAPSNITIYGNKIYNFSSTYGIMAASLIVGIFSYDIGKNYNISDNRVYDVVSGIYLGGAGTTYKLGAYVSDNDISGTSSYGIYVGRSANSLSQTPSVITSNYVHDSDNSTSAYAIGTAESYTNIYGNTIYNFTNGIVVTQSFTNISNNIISTIRINGLSLTGGTGNIVNNISLNSVTGTGMFIATGANSISDINLNNCGNGTNIQTFTANLSNMITDSIIINSSDFDIVTSLRLITSAYRSNLTLLNVSFNSSKLSIINSTRLWVKWYYQAYVNNTSGNNLANVNVSAVNSTGNLVFNITTSSTGFTDKITIPDFAFNGTQYSYSSPFNITAKAEHYSDVMHTFTTSFDNQYDTFTLSSSCTPIFPLWILNLDHTCTISNYDFTTNLSVISTKQGGYAIFNNSNFTVKLISTNFTSGSKFYILSNSRFRFLI